MNDNLECKPGIGQFMPLLDRNRCEGKAACVAVCPVDVFAVQTLSPTQRAEMTLKGRLKGYFLKWQQATTARPCMDQRISASAVSEVGELAPGGLRLPGRLSRTARILHKPQG